MFECAVCELKCQLNYNMATPENFNQWGLLADVVDCSVWATSDVYNLVWCQQGEHSCSRQHTLVYRLLCSTSQSTGQNMFDFPVGLHNMFI